MSKLRINHDRLEEIKKEEGFTSDRQFAQDIGVSHPYITQIKNGSRGVGLAFVTAMYVQLDIPFNPGEAGSLYWLEEEEEEN